MPEFNSRKELLEFVEDRVRESLRPYIGKIDKVTTIKNVKKILNTYGVPEIEVNIQMSEDSEIIKINDKWDIHVEKMKNA
jgi:hypothetical protein